MVTYKLSSQFAPRARGLPSVKQNRRVSGSAAAASVRLSLPGGTLDETGKLSLSGSSNADKTGKLSLSGRTLDETGKLSLSGLSDADKTGEEMLPRCRNGDDCHQRKPKLRLTGRDGPPGLYDQKVTGGTAFPVTPAVVWFATQQPATAGTRKDLSASAGPDNVRSKEGNAGPARLKSFRPNLCYRADRRGLTKPIETSVIHGVTTSGMNHVEATEWESYARFILYFIG